jgi:hypothetical protein
MQLISYWVGGKKKKKKKNNLNTPHTFSREKKAKVRVTRGFERVPLLDLKCQADQKVYEE